MACGQFMNLCRPPSAAMRSAPGRSMRWYVLASTMSAPLARRASEVMPFTVACVPTGMNAGVATMPWAVVISPHRAAPSRARRRKEKRSSISSSHRHARPRSPACADCVNLSALPGIHVLYRGQDVDGRAKPGHDDQSRSFFEEQAGIAVGIKSIIALDRMRVSTLHDIEPTKCGNQHEQGR